MKNSKGVKKKNRRRRKGKVVEKVLEAIADYLIKAGGYYKPRINVILGLLIKYVLAKKRGLEKRDVSRIIKSLEKKKILHVKEEDGKVYILFEKAGKLFVSKYYLRKLLNYKRKEKRWDGRWFLVFFDVPEKERKARDYLRRYLKFIGFKEYQKSVYIFPYECEEEVKFLKGIFEGGSNISYVIAEKIEFEDKFIKLFKLTQKA